MTTLVIASQKGGAGKSTIAAHLAVMADLAEYGPIVLIDTDPQGSLSAWWNSRDSDTPSLAGTNIIGLKSKLEALSKSGFKLVVIDTPPAITTESGGQNPPPERIKGKKPAIVVKVVVRTWRVVWRITSIIAWRSPVCALRSVLSAVSTVMESFTATPTRPTVPMIGLKPKG